MKLYLIRHGSLPDRCAGRFIGLQEVSLSEKGRAECACVGSLLAGKKVDAVFASPLRRAAESAELAFPGRKDVVFDPRLREMDFGKWENLTFEEISRLYPESAAFWAQRSADMAFPGGGSAAEQKQAVKSFWDELKNRPFESVAVVTHGGVIVQFLSLLLQLDDDQAWRLLPARGTLSQIDLSPAPEHAARVICLGVGEKWQK